VPRVWQQCTFWWAMATNEFGHFTSWAVHVNGKPQMCSNLRKPGIDQARFPLLPITALLQRSLTYLQSGISGVTNMSILHVLTEKSVFELQNMRSIPFLVERPTPNVRSSSSLSTFERRLKAELFSRSFPVVATKPCNSAMWLREFY